MDNYCLYRIVQHLNCQHLGNDLTNEKLSKMPTRETPNKFILKLHNNNNIDIKQWSSKQTWTVTVAKECRGRYPLLSIFVRYVLVVAIGQVIYRLNVLPSSLSFHGWEYVSIFCISLFLLSVQPMLTLVPSIESEKQFQICFLYSVIVSKKIYQILFNF